MSKMIKNIADLSEAIKTAKLGRARKEAQVDTCTAFAAALYDILKARGVECRLITASCSFGMRSSLNWAHAVVGVGNRYYDSMGEFSASLYRQRAKIHPKVDFKITFKVFGRACAYEDELQGYYDFYSRILEKSIA